MLSRIPFAVSVAWRRSGATGRLILFLVVLLSIIFGGMKLLLWQGQREEHVRLEVEARQRAELHAKRSADWNEHKDAVKANLADALKGGRLLEVRNLINQYWEVAGSDLIGAERQLKIAEQKRLIDGLAVPDQAIAREVAVRDLMNMDSANPQWKKEYARAKRDADVYRLRAEMERKRDEQRNLAERRKHGVQIGMLRRDVLLSSWGKPESVNKTVTGTRVREQWVYGNGHYLYFDDGILTSIQTSSR